MMLNNFADEGVSGLLPQLEHFTAQMQSTTTATNKWRHANPPWSIQLDESVKEFRTAQGPWVNVDMYGTVVFTLGWSIFQWPTWHGLMWNNISEIIHICTAVVDESEEWSSHLLQWSFFTVIYNHSTNMNYFIYISHHFTPHGKIWTQSIDLAKRGENLW